MGTIPLGTGPCPLFDPSNLKVGGRDKGCACAGVGVPRTTAMLAAARTPRHDRIAIAGSIAIHLCVLIAWATLPRPSISNEDPDERTLFASIIRAEHHAPARIALRAHEAGARPIPVSGPKADLPIIHAAVTHERAARALVVATERRAPSVAAQLAVQHRAVNPVRS